MSDYNTLTTEEEKMIIHVNNYFKIDMPLEEKLFYAALITQHDLESHNFSNKTEHDQIIYFKNILDKVQRKIRFASAT